MARAPRQRGTRDALQSLFEKVLDVDYVLRNWAKTGSLTRPGPEAEPQAEMVLSQDASRGHESTTITVENAYPMPTTRFTLINVPGVAVRRDVAGLSFQVLVRGMGNPETLLQNAAEMVLETAPGFSIRCCR